MASRTTSTERREPGWIGRDDRLPVAVRGRVFRADGASLEVMLSDMSRDGCRLECSETMLEIGEWIDVEAEGNDPQRGQVRWSLLGSAGVQFLGA